MFVIVLTYVEPLGVVDRHLAAHVEYLKNSMRQGFLLPRAGEFRAPVG